MVREVNASKLKILYVMKFFTEQTDIQNPVSAKDVIEYLNLMGISAERKSIYSDVDVLNKFGIKIAKKGHRFYFAGKN